MEEFQDLALFHQSMEGREFNNTVAYTSFDTYDTVWDKIKQCVDDTLALGTQDLDWEEESNENEEDEEVDAFRTDPTDPAVPVAYERQDTFKQVEQEPTNYVELEDKFHQELSKAHILAEFDERYIQIVLQIRRESNGNTTSLELDERHRLWEETVSEHPLLVLENLSRGMMALANRAPTRIPMESQESTATIQELGDDAIELSLASRSFSSFIPNTIPQLNVDSLLG